jgi:hypothetical protein
MNELGYIGADELVFNNDKEKGIHSGGFSVKSIMMKAGMSPIMTLNMSQFGGKSDKVSDLFDNLVIPNWTLTYNNNTDKNLGGNKNIDNDDTNSESDDDVIDDDIHDKLLGLVKEYNIKGAGTKKKITIKNRKGKKSITKKYSKK